jgi:hypothetical protein
MGSKRYKGKTCVYCAGVSEEPDHVLAREFVPVAYRSQIPQVPACRRCNKEKSDLEHYSATVLPFGGRHGDAAANLQNDGPRRLAGNQKLRRELVKGRERISAQESPGLAVSALALPIDGAKVEKLVEFIVRGLMFHHWDIVLGRDCFVDTGSLTSFGEAYFALFRSMRTKNPVAADICNGALIYKGVQAIDNPQVSVWEIALLGGVKMASADNTDFSSTFGAMTGPQSIKDRAEAADCALNPS